MRRFLLLPFIWSTPVLAAFDRPIPQPQSATAEIWFGLASLALLAALLLVNHLVMRK
ncbi:MAG: protein NnrT [Albidovulum sp.]